MREKDSTKEQMKLMRGEWRMWKKICTNWPIQGESKKKKLFQMKTVLHNNVS